MIASISRSLLTLRNIGSERYFYFLLQTLPPHVSPFVDENDEERYIPEREKELRGLETSTEPHQATAPVTNNKSFDIVEEKKQKMAQKKQEEKEFTNISKSLMSNTNRKLLRNIQHGQKQKQ